MGQNDKEWYRQYRIKNKEKMEKYRLEYYRKNREKMLEKQRILNKKNYIKSERNLVT
jgi:hypothetical protein